MAENSGEGVQAPGGARSFTLRVTLWVQGRWKVVDLSTVVATFCATPAYISVSFQQLYRTRLLWRHIEVPWNTNHRQEPLYLLSIVRIEGTWYINASTTIYSIFTQTSLMASIIDLAVRKAYWRICWDPRLSKTICGHTSWCHPRWLRFSQRKNLRVSFRFFPSFRDLLYRILMFFSIFLTAW